ncbi:MAG TPA: hypothetical protein VGK67_38535 [Myxococcales bacterium]
MPALPFFAAALAVAAGFLVLGAASGRRVRSAAAFGLAGRSATATGVSGTLLGALVGGASTVGTAELAYQHGLSACWFTVGGGLGCLVLGLWLAGPLRRSALETIPQFLEAQYGRPVGLVVLASSSLGTFLSVVAQLIAGAALLRALAPIDPLAAGSLVVLLTVGFAAAGGLKSFAALGQTKIALLYAVALCCAGAAWRQGSTPGRLWEALPHATFFDPIGLGWADASAATSLVVGVLCTQIYVQAVFSAADERTARRGALISAALMPPLGALGIWVGLSMRATGQVVPPAQVLPAFLQLAFPAPVAGALWAVLLLTVVGTAAGLALGMATNLSRDLPALRSESPWPARLAFLALVLAAALLSLGRQTPILAWSYLAMGLRGAGTFFPFLLAILRPGLLPGRWALASSLLGLAATLAWPLGNLGGEPLFAGLLVSGICTGAGTMASPASRPRLGGSP